MQQQLCNSLKDMIDAVYIVFLAGANLAPDIREIQAVLNATWHLNHA